MSVKCRIGIDDLDSYEFFKNFIQILIENSHLQHVAVHCRKAWLNGLSPKQNRSIPPINYDFLLRIIKELPQIHFTLNGQVETMEQIHFHLEKVPSVMIGRAAFENPMILHRIEKGAIFEI